MVSAVADLTPNFYWRDYNHGHAPHDALEAASGLYIGQAHFSDGLFPVAIYPYRNSAVAVYGQRRDVTNHLKILCTSQPGNFYWETVDFNTDNVTMMKDAVVGGFQETYLAYIGLVHYQDNWMVGKVFDIEVKDWKGQARFSDGLFPVAIYPYRNSAVAVYGQRRDVTNHLKILCTPQPSNFYWQTVDLNTDNVTMMKDAIVGGFEQTSLAYIGLVDHLGNWKVGKAFDMENVWRGIY
ncbi:Protein of unknown function (DUF3421) [Popillia japonica]|uniref:Lectin n=1 Tax=Popillia japonica TaxID=7064 RepID=A0AAW1KI17_POPJA